MSRNAKYAEALAKAMDDKEMSNLALGLELNIGAANVSHWRTGHRPLPANRAKAVAEILGVSPESISRLYEQEREQADSESHSGTVAGESRNSATTPPGYLHIPRLTGFGRAAGPAHLLLPDFVVRKKIGATPITRVRWTINPSRAMEPSIDRGDLILVDASVNSLEAVVDGDVYAFSLRSRPDVRRILIRSDHWTIKGAEKDSEFTDLFEKDLAELDIFGLVLGHL